MKLLSSLLFVCYIANSLSQGPPIIPCATSETCPVFLPSCLSNQCGPCVATEDCNTKLPGTFCNATGGNCYYEIRGDVLPLNAISQGSVAVLVIFGIMYFLVIGLLLLSVIWNKRVNNSVTSVTNSTAMSSQTQDA